MAYSNPDDIAAPTSPKHKNSAAPNPPPPEPIGYNHRMSITEIKTIVSQLPPPELADFAQWFEDFQEDAWDRQIARDVQAGRFDPILQRVDEQAESGQCRPL